MQQNNNRGLLWLEWMVATLIGYTIGILAILPWMVNLAYAAQPGWSTGLMGGTILGGAVGVAQWLVLRRHAEQVGWWIVATIAGFMVGLGIGMPLADTGFMPTGAALRVAYNTGMTGAIVGVVLGLFQWVVLRRFIPSAALWIVASALGWMVGMGLGAAISTWSTTIGSLLVSGLSCGVVTGIVMQYLMRQKVSSSMVNSAE